jgi:hypothetical protein
MPSDGKRRHAVVTDRPDIPAPPLYCPTCSGTLPYQQTVYGGVRPAERWDQYHCTICGAFEYRHRTRRLRPVEAVS